MRDIDPDSPENQEATKQIEREKFALKMQAKQLLECPVCEGSGLDDANDWCPNCNGTGAVKPTP